MDCCLLQFIGIYPPYDDWVKLLNSRLQNEKNDLTPPL